MNATSSHYVIRAAITPAVRRLSLSTHLRDLRRADQQAFAAGEWNRVGFIRVCIDDARDELETLERHQIATSETGAHA